MQPYYYVTQINIIEKYISPVNDNFGNRRCQETPYVTVHGLTVKAFSEIHARSSLLVRAFWPRLLWRDSGLPHLKSFIHLTDRLCSNETVRAGSMVITRSPYCRSAHCCPCVAAAAAASAVVRPNACDTSSTMFFPSVFSV